MTWLYFVDFEGRDSNNLTFVKWHTKISWFVCKAMLGLLQKHCPVCGMDVDKNIAIKRFGKYFCSDEHASQYAQMKMERETDRESGMGRGGGCC